MFFFFFDNFLTNYCLPFVPGKKIENTRFLGGFFGPYCTPYTLFGDKICFLLSESVFKTIPKNRLRAAWNWNGVHIFKLPRGILQVSFEVIFSCRHKYATLTAYVGQCHLHLFVVTRLKKIRSIPFWKLQKKMFLMQTQLKYLLGGHFWGLIFGPYCTPYPYFSVILGFNPCVQGLQKHE